MKASIAITCWFVFSLHLVTPFQNEKQEIISDLQTQHHENHENFEITNRSLDPEATMSVIEMIRYHGYTVEEFDVQTEDGYILTIHHIPYGKKGPGSQPRKPVIVQHGLLCSSAIWILNTPDKNLAYILADEGYDVWLTNVRGNDFGRKHVDLSPDSKEFWKFSWDEMAEHDMPAMIDFILKKTGFEQTFYIGHSMGTTIAFAMLASKPEYNSKIAGVMALAPVAYVDHLTSPIRLLAPFADDVGFLVTLLGNGELLASSKVLDFLTSSVCNSNIKILCSSVLFVLCGFNLPQLNQTRLPVYLHKTPAGSSSQNVIHYAQEIKSHKFAKYDFGFWENKEKYGQGTPPTYRIDNINAPVAAFWSDNDLLANPEDIARLAKQLPNLVLNYRVPDPNFSHLDYMWAIDINTLVYDRLVSKMKELWQD